MRDLPAIHQLTVRPPILAAPPSPARVEALQTTPTKFLCPEAGGPQGCGSVKEAKTARSRRTIALPERLVDELRNHRKAQAAWRLNFGLGKDPLNLLFRALNGGYWTPRAFSKAFAREISSAKLPHVTFHGARHTHITHLLRSGVPVHVVSARAGHANPTVTLNIYAHLLPGQQEGAAAVFDATLRAALED